MPWYVYTEGDPSVNTNYVSSGTSVPGCSGDVTLCAIYAQAGGAGRPVITQGVYMAAQQAFGGVETEGVTLLKSTS